MLPDDAESLKRRISELEAEVARLEKQQSDSVGDRRFLERLLQAIPAYVSRYDSKRRLRYANRLPKGMAMKDVLGTPAEQFLAPEEREATLATVQRAVENRRIEHLIATAVGHDGALAHYQSVIAPIEDEDGSTGFILVAFDITDELQNQAELARSKATLEVAVAATGVALYRANYETGEIEWSERMKELMGRDEPVAGAEYIQQLVHPDDRELATRGLLQARRGDRKGWVTHRIVRPDGSVRWVLPTGSVVHNDKGEPLYSVGGFLDVTETHALEERLHQAERLESLGTLTSGVAHNLNNLLAVLVPNLDMLAEHVDAEGQPMLKESTDTTWRAKQVVRKLMTFTRRREGSEHREILLDQVVGEVVAGFQRQLSNPTSIEFLAPTTPVPVRCDPADLSEVVMNLLVNACDALTLQDTTRPRVIVEIREDEAPPASLAARVEARYASVSVSDNGPGMSEAVQKRIFNPFFSTKGPRGLGMGLAMSWNSVSAARGTITCDSTLGEGTRFTVYLPRSTRQPSPPSQAPPLPDTILPLRVLVVDDDEAVRVVVKRSLLRAGHQVVEAASGSEALEQARPGIDLVLLDHFLPDQFGSSLIQPLRQLAPGIVVVLFSGEDLDDSQTDQADAVLTKPFTAQELVARLADIMAKSSRRERAR